MSSNLVSIRLSTNHPNIMYATTPIIGTLRDFRNFNFLIPTNLHPPMDIPKALVFHDSKLDATGTAQYTNSRLPKSFAIKESSGTIMATNEGMKCCSYTSD